MADPWWQATCRVDISVADDVAAEIIEAGALGVEFITGHFGQILEDGPMEESWEKIAPIPHETGDATLVCNFPGELGEQRVREALVAAASAMGVRLEPSQVEVLRREDSAWELAWRDNFKPLRLTSSLWVAPPWEEVSLKPGEQRITIDPGMAFGTGQHATTALCAQRLETLFKPGMSVLDVGCGSAILAIAARKLGAKHVVGIDIDPDAVDSALANLPLNHAQDIALSTTALQDLDGAYDVVIANILAPALIELCDEIIVHTQPDGFIVLSGLLRDQIASVNRVYTERGIPLEAGYDGDWAVLWGRR